MDWLAEDPENPQSWPGFPRWLQLSLIGFATLSLTAASSAYGAAQPDLERQFHVSGEVTLLGISLFVIGFGAGPLVWSPLSDIYGRRTMYIFSFAMLTLWTSVTVAAQNIASVLVFRFLSGFFGGVPLSSAGASVADLFPISQRGIALAVFTSTAFLGPAVGPITGGFIAQKAGWRWIEGYLAIFSGVVTLALVLLASETCAPVLLRRRASRLSKSTGKVFRYRGDGKITTSPGQLLSRAVLSPWKFLLEPIVLVLTIYMSIIYGVVYLNFAAYPIVFQELRGWSQGIGGLAFLGIVVGVVLALLCVVFIINPRFNSTASRRGGSALPEDRLEPAVVGGISALIGLVGFAATASPNVHFIAPIIFGAPFGFGVVLIFLAVIGYLVDAYSVYAASVLAANAFVRAAFAAAFPLFTVPMYDNLGVHWASAIPAFLILACIPAAMILQRYGATIRAKSKWAARAEKELKAIVAARQAAMLATKINEEA